MQAGDIHVSLDITSCTTIQSSNIQTHMYFSRLLQIFLMLSSCQLVLISRLSVFAKKQVKSSEFSTGLSIQGSCNGVSWIMHAIMAACMLFCIRCLLHHSCSLHKMIVRQRRGLSLSLCNAVLPARP